MKDWVAMAEAGDALLGMKSQSSQLPSLGPGSGDPVEGPNMLALELILGTPREEHSLELCREHSLELQ
jgi:hypothetical protein